jgi:hypothetical protein
MARFTRIAAVLAALVLTLAFASLAQADSPHFLKASASGPNSDGQLVVSFKEAGLGDNQTIAYRASATATATYACINGGDNHPQANNKVTFTEPVTKNGSFSSGKNGTISQSLPIDPPSAGTFSCPPGQRMALASVKYVEVAITDTTNDVTEGIPGTFSRTFVAV